MDNNDKILEEIRKYCDSYSILVIADRRLIRIRCPFKVRVRIEFAGWNEGDIVKVEKIMVTRDLFMVYIIGGNGYHFYLFQILLP
jgi:hypothetical protein